MESIYRDLEYARSLVKRRHEEEENATVRDKHYSITSADLSPTFEPYTDSSHEGSNGSSAAGGAPSDDWSVISGALDDERPEIHRTTASTTPSG